MSDSLLSSFRKVAFAEGISFLVLLGIAMPLKYFAGMPLAVRLVGSVHGMLFIAYVVLVGRLLKRGSWTVGFAAWAMFLSVVPFGTFMLERQLSRQAPIADA